jgi:hypothetical protein
VGERVPRPVLWQAVLLLPHPILTLLYLLAVRAERVQPSFAPVVVLVILPILSTMVGVAHLRRASSTGSRGGQMVLLALAALEASFTVLAAAVVGFAIGLQSL